MDLLEYRETRDPKHIKDKRGKKAARFHLRPIPTSLFLRIVNTAPTQEEKEIRAFMLALDSVTDHVTPDGTKIADWQPLGKVEAQGTTWKMVDDDQLDQFLPHQVEEIGAIAWRRCALGKASAAPYPVRPLLAAALEAMSRRAAQNPDD